MFSSISLRGVASRQTVCRTINPSIKCRPFTVQLEQLPSLTPAVKKPFKRPAAVNPSGNKRSINQSKSFPFGNPRSVTRPYEPSISNLRVNLKYDRRHTLSKIDRKIDRRPHLPISPFRLHKLLHRRPKPHQSTIDNAINSHKIKASISSLVPFIKACSDHTKYQKFFLALRKTQQSINQYPQLSLKIKQSYHQAISQCHQIIHQRLVDQSANHSETFSFSHHRSAYTRLTTVAIQSLMKLNPSDPSITHLIYQILVDYQSINQSNNSVGSIIPYCEYVKHLCSSSQFDAAIDLVAASPHPTLIETLIDSLAHRNEMNRIVETIKRFNQSINLSVIHCALKSLVYSSKPSKSTGICSLTRGMHSAADKLSGWATQVWTVMENAGITPTPYTYSLLSHPAYHANAASISTLVQAVISDRRVRLTDQLVMHLAARCAEFGQWNDIMSLLSLVRVTSRKVDQVDQSKAVHPYMGPSWRDFIPSQGQVSLPVMSDMLGALQSELKFNVNRLSKQQRGIAGSEAFNVIARALAAPSFNFNASSGGVEVPPLALFSQLSQITFHEGHNFTYHTLLALISRCGDWNENELMWQLFKQARSIALTQPGVSQPDLFIALIHAASCMDSSVQLRGVAQLMAVHEKRASRPSRFNMRELPLTRRVYAHLIRAYLKRSDYGGLFETLSMLKEQHFTTHRIERYAYATVVASLHDHPDMFQLLVRHMFSVCQRPFSKRELQMLNDQWKARIADINPLQGEDGIDRAIQAISA